MVSAFWTTLGIICFADQTFGVLSRQCYDMSCNGSNCLRTEVLRNPLLIKKCSRVIYKGCYTVTTTFSGVSIVTAGCVDRLSDCSAGSCSGSFIKSGVSCCNKDLCNNGEIPSGANKIRHLTNIYMILCILYSAL